MWSVENTITVRIPDEGTSLEELEGRAADALQGAGRELLGQVQRILDPPVPPLPKQLEQFGLQCPLQQAPQQLPLSLLCLSLEVPVFRHVAPEIGWRWFVESLCGCHWARSSRSYVPCVLLPRVRPWIYTEYVTLPPSMHRLTVRQPRRSIGSL